MKKYTKKTFSIYILSILILSSFVYTVPALTNSHVAKAASDGEYTLLEPLPCIPGQGIECPASMKKTIDFRNYMQYAFNLLIGLAAAAAVFMMVWGGFKYMSTDSWSNKSEGLDMFKHAIYGLLLVLASYLILKTIDPRLVEIPSNIVPTITLKKSITHSSGQFFDQILSDAKQQQMITDTLINQAKDLRASTEELEKRRAELYVKIMGATDDTNKDDIKQWQIEFEKLTAEINQKEGSTLRLFGASSMSETLSKTDRQLGIEKAADTSNYVLFYGSVTFTKQEIDDIINSSIKNIDKEINPPVSNTIVYNRVENMKTLAPEEYENLKKEAEKNKISLELRRMEATVANTTTVFNKVFVGNMPVRKGSIVQSASGFYQDLKQNSATLEQQINSQISDAEVKKEFTTRIKNINDSLNKKFGN